MLSTSTRNGRTLIAVVIGEVTADDRDVKAAELLEKGFGASSFAAPRLASMAPSGDYLATATNMREAICTKAARQRIAAQRKAQGKIVVRSPYLHPMDRPRQIAMIELAGATDSAPAGPTPDSAEYADVPVPTPRPQYPVQPAQGD